MQKGYTLLGVLIVGVPRRIKLNLLNPKNELVVEHISRKTILVENSLEISLYNQWTKLD